MKCTLQRTPAPWGNPGELRADHAGRVTEATVPCRVKLPREIAVMDTHARLITGGRGARSALERLPLDGQIRGNGDGNARRILAGDGGQADGTGNSADLLFTVTFFAQLFVKSLPFAVGADQPNVGRLGP